MKTSRLLYAGAFLVCLIIISVALYMQHVLDMEPCPLCIFQRMAIMAIGAVCLLAAVHNPDNFIRKIYGLGVSIIALIGAGLAARHDILAEPCDGDQEDEHYETE